MKRRLYLVVKHGARFAVISLVFIPVLRFVYGMVSSGGDVDAAKRAMICLRLPGDPGLVVTQILLVICPVLLTIGVSRYEHLRRVRRLPASEAAPKLQADASAPLLAAGEQAGGIEAG
jgi:hypothetical protein